MKDILMRTLSVFDVDTIASLFEHERHLKGIGFTPVHVLALLHFALNTPRSHGQHLDTVLTYCRKNNLPAPEEDNQVTMEELTQLAVLFCNHSILCHAIQPSDLGTLRCVEDELRNIIYRMVVDEHDPDVDALLAEAERFNRLPMVEGEEQRELQWSRYHLWLFCFVDYLHTLRHEPDRAVVLPLPIVSRIFMRLPPRHCPFCQQ